MDLVHEELIGFNPIEISGVGSFKVPKLQEIWDIKHSTYQTMCSYLAVDLNKYLELTGLTEKYMELNEEDKKTNSLFNMISNNKEFINSYLLIFSFFILGQTVFEADKNCFSVWLDNEKIGQIDGSNFLEIRDILLQINYLNRTASEIEIPKYKNETAKKWAEKLNKSKEKKENKDELSLGKLISKYCSDNKNGINILNVYNMTIYQFYDQWIQHNHMKQCDMQDRIYANTVSFSDLKSYDSQLWLK